MLTPVEYYQHQVRSGLIQSDSQQREVIDQLQKIYDDLLCKHKRSKGLSKFFRQKKIVNGLYIWGSVGVGKTFLMDCFCLCYPLAKMRMHFHVFLQYLHKALQKKQGCPNPLSVIAKDVAKKNTVICFDEFFVENIADAMILGEFLTALFSEGVSLITTSNVAPDLLYQDGLQREKFLPVIELIKAKNTVYHMISHHDYRLRHSQQAKAYFSPLGLQSEKYMLMAFEHLAKGQPITERPVTILGRQIASIKHAKKMIWFELNVLCGVPRSQNDYIEISKNYHTVFISGVPVFQSKKINLTQAFINLIDVFYDAHVRVVMSAAADIENLYPEGRLKFEFARTQSRLIEMQSLDYFEQCQR